jgi:hypothetical protein
MLKQPVLRSVLIKFVLPHLGVITVILFAVSLALVVNLEMFARPTEIEEHALMPGYARSGYVARGGERVEFTSTTLVSECRWVEVPARRGDGREAVVVLFTSPSPVVSSLARYFSSVPWLSKDVVLVECNSTKPYAQGTREWLKYYSSLPTSPLIRQSVVFNPRQGGRGPWLVEVEGVNGMLPNQDWVNTLVSECKSKGVDVRFRGVFDSLLYSALNGGVHSHHSPFLEMGVPRFKTTLVFTRLFSV